MRIQLHVPFEVVWLCAFWAMIPILAPLSYERYWQLVGWSLGLGRWIH